MNELAFDEENTNPVLNPDHPIFAPMQAALIERFSRKAHDINIELKYACILTHHRYVIERRRSKFGSWNSTWKTWACRST